MTFKQLQDFIENKMRIISGIIPLLSVMLLGILDSQGYSVYAHDFSKEISSNNPRPHQQSFNIGEQFASDSFQIGYHGWFYSHIDALCHMFHDEKMYNGFEKTLISSEGSQRLGIQNMKNGFFHVVYL